MTTKQSARIRVLWVDDDPDLLAAMSRNLRLEQMEVVTATSGFSALDVLKEHGPFAVIVSDLRMPGMDGVELLGRARGIAPDTVRVLFTGQPDMERAIAAVNEGAVFRFITKPSSRPMLAMVVKSAAEQYSLITAERVLLEQTLRGSIKALTDILALISPLAFGRATRLRQGVSALAAAVQVSNVWQVEVAAMLSQIGAVIIPPATLEKVQHGRPLTVEEEGMLRRVAEVEEQILGNIPRLEEVVKILQMRHASYSKDGPSPSKLVGDAIPWGARALKIVADLDELETEGLPASVAFGTMRGRVGHYDPVLLEAMAEIRNALQGTEVCTLPISKLRSGMVLAQDVFTEHGVLFLARGQEVTPSLIERFENFAPSFLVGASSLRVIVHERPR